MNIAIFHELERGGGLSFAENISKEFVNNSHKVTIYSTKDTFNSKYCSQKQIYCQDDSNNLFIDIWKSIVNLSSVHKIIAKQIDDNKFDLVLVFPSTSTQSPHLLRYLKRKSSIIYFFLESKREFYEPTSYDYYTFKRTIARFLRLPLKYVDIINCRNATNIVAISQYSKNVLRKIYRKNSYVIYPGMVLEKPELITRTNKTSILSVGLHSMIKGHDITINQFSNKTNKVFIIGSETKETKYLDKLAKKNHTNLNFVYSNSDTKKNEYLKKLTVYVANPRKEPFGLATLEASINECFLLGTNDGGTPEIIRHGLNGYLYPSNLEIIRQVTSEITTLHKMNYYKVNRLSWDNNYEHLLSLYHYLKNEPQE